MSSKRVEHIRSVFAAEALAYVKSGILLPGGARSVRTKRRHDEDARLSVVFVPGVGANASQFAELKRALSEEVDHFDAFEYSSLANPRKIARALGEHLHDSAGRCERLLVIGHSLGGLLLRMVLQEDDAPGVAGFVSICAPLHGTWYARLAPSPHLRKLAPDSELVRGVLDRAHRLDGMNGSILTVGVRYDHFITPYDSAFLDGHEQLCLKDTGHVASLFDERVHEAIARLARKLRAQHAAEHKRG